MTELVLTHSPREVTVYPDRARVSSRGAADLTAGTTALVFDDLPLGLEPDSVRFSGSGDAAVRVLSLDVGRKHYAETPSAAAQKLEAEKEALLLRQRALQDEQAVWEAELAQLNGLRQASDALAGGLARGKTTMESLGQMMALLQQRDREAREALRELEPQQLALGRRLEKLERELAELRSQRPRMRFQARVEIEVTGGGAFEAELSYVVGNASWHPLYDLRLEERAEDGRPLDVTVFAAVRQQTGQDWQDVALTVSTARPALSRDPGELEPWYLEVYEALERLMAAMPAFSNDTLVGGLAETPPAAAGTRAKRAEYVAPVVEDAGAVVTYRVAGRSTIASDGAPHKNLLAQFAAGLALTYLARPKQATAVFRRGTFANESGAPLLAGAGNLFVDGEYVGRTEIEYTAVGDELELLLGVEERITAERELVRRKVDKRFLRENRLLHYAYDIKLKNLLPHAVEVEVQDQIPVARHEAIKVRLDEVSPVPDEQSELQILTWKLAVDPAAEAQIHFAYTVEYPPTLDVIGLQD